MTDPYTHEKRSREALHNTTVQLCSFGMHHADFECTKKTEKCFTTTVQLTTVCFYCYIISDHHFIHKITS